MAAKKSNKDAREIRQLHRRGLTYREIADRLGIHESNVCRFMRKRGYRVQRNRRIVKGVAGRDSSHPLGMTTKGAS